MAAMWLQAQHRYSEMGVQSLSGSCVPLLLLQKVLCMAPNRTQLAAGCQPCLHDPSSGPLRRACSQAAGGEGSRVGSRSVSPAPLALTRATHRVSNPCVPWCSNNILSISRSQRHPLRSLPRSRSSYNPLKSLSQDPATSRAWMWDVGPLKVDVDNARLKKSY
eukprot:COSAG01_NODE_1642_length_9641_cov_14.964682_1_plen_163_part_00